MLISENLPRRAGFPPTPGRAAKRFDWTPGGRQPGAGSRELGAGSRDRTGSREAREIRVLNHWAAGLRSRLLAEGCGVATPESAQKRCPKLRSLERKNDFWPHEMRERVVSPGFHEWPGGFLLGVGPPIDQVGGEL